MNNLKASFFLASSWFWCIGGFFPVLLITQFGKMAFFPFFVFNIIGAAAFGFVFNHNSREQFAIKYKLPTKMFSSVIISYQTVFVVWISLVIQSVLPFIAFLIFSLLFYKYKNKLFSVAVILFFVTVLLFVLMFNQNYHTQSIHLPDMSGFIHYIIPTAFGFLLAPYFDLTFHTAFKQSSNTKQSFFIGFGVLFLLYLVGMFFAAPYISSLWMNNISINKLSLLAIVLLLTMQLAFTNVAHIKEIESNFLNLKNSFKIIIIIIALVVIHLFVAVYFNNKLFDIGLLFYRLFLFIIGVIFPLILIFKGINKFTIITAVLLSVFFTIGFFIGGELTFFLSIAMLTLPIMLYFKKRYS